MRWMWMLAVLAASPGDSKTVQIRGRDAFMKALDVDRISIDARGNLRLGYAVSMRAVADEPAVWCGVTAGGATHVGTSTGKIYALKSDAKLEFETGEMAVTALVEQNGEIFASTIPSGKIFRRSEKGEWTEAAALSSKYVWDLIQANGQVYAACGEPAALVRITGKGSPEVVFTAKADHILCALASGDGFWVGTANPGMLIHTSTGRVHHDFQAAEVRSIVQGQGSLWVAANLSKVSPSELIRSAQNSGVGDPVAAAGANRPPVAADLWKISETKADDLVVFPSTWINALRPTPEGVLVLTNNSGRVFHVMTDGTLELRDDLKSGQACGFVRGGTGVLLGGRGRVAIIGSKPAEQGTWLSTIHDAGFVSNWGRIELRSKGKVEVQVRTGLVQHPDDGWTPWSDPISEFPAKIACAKGRYIQLKVTLRDAAAEVSEIQFSYRNENQYPRISSIKVDSLVGMAPMEMPLPGTDPGQKSPPLHSPLKQVTWQAQDPDGDELVYTLKYRAQNSKQWLPVAEGQSILANSVRWNTDAIPDGVYVLKVEASDERGNAPAEKLTAEMETAPFVIDNGKPALKVSLQDGRLAGSATDAVSKIVRLEYQIDGAEWRAFSTKDGLFDSKTEEFDVALPPLKAGPHSITVRAVDEEMNSAVAVVETDR